MAAFLDKLPERLRAKVKLTERGCMEWQGEINRNGYGRLWFGGHRHMAHKFTFELYKGPIRQGALVDHLCRNRCCVNPDHLELVTPKLNVIRVHRRRKMIDENGMLVGGKMTPSGAVCAG